MFGGENVGGLGVHLDVGGGKAGIFYFIDLQELIAEFDAVVKPKERHHLIAKARVVFHSVSIENSEDAIKVVVFQGTLKITQNVADDFVGKVERLCRRQLRRGILGRRCLGG